MTETTQLFSDPLKLPTKPPTEGVLRANEKTSGETQILDKGLLLLSNIVDFDSLAPNKKELLTAFEKPSVQIWSTFEYENIEDAKKQADIVVFLASGLASTHEQWNMNGLSFIHRLASDVQEIERSSSTKLLGEKTAAQKILYVSVNQPGFGSMQFSAETRKKPKKELVDLVSDENYAEMMSVIYEGMGLSDVEDKLVAVGHSAGGEMICTAALKKKFKNALLFAVNPSVGIDAQSLFDGLRLLTEAGGWMPGSLKNAIQPHVISRVTGSSGPMVTLHNEQATVNVEAFIAKLAQLAEEGRRGLMDSFSDGSQSTDNLLSIVNNLQIIFAEQDVLTPERHITAWYDLAKSTIQKSLGELGITLSIDQNALSPYIKVPKATHDTLFVDTKVQSQYTRPIATAIIERIKVNKLFAQASRVSRAELVDIVPPTVPVEDLPLLVETESAVPLELIDGDFPEAVPDQSPLVYVKPELTRLDANEDVVEPVPQDEVVTTTIPAEEIPEVPELGVELQGPAEILQEQTDVTVVDSTQDEKVPEVRHEIPKVSQFFIKAIKQSQADGFECRVNVSTDNKQELYQLLKNYTIMEDPSASFQEKQTASKELQKIYNYEFVFRTQFVSNLFNAPHKLSSRLKEIVEESDSEKIVVPHEVINEFYLDIFSSESFKLYYLGKSEEKYNDFLSIMEELRTNTLRDPARLVSRFILGPFTDGRTAILKTSYVLEDRDNPKFSVMDVIFQVANGEQSENGVVFSRTKVEEILEIVSNQVHLESWKGIAGQRAAVFEFNSVADAASFAKLLQN